MQTRSSVRCKRKANWSDPEPKVKTRKPAAASVISQRVPKFPALGHTASWPTGTAGVRTIFDSVRYESLISHGCEQYGSEGYKSMSQLFGYLGWCHADTSQPYISPDATAFDRWCATSDSHLSVVRGLIRSGSLSIIKSPTGRLRVVELIRAKQWAKVECIFDAGVDLSDLTVDGVGLFAYLRDKQSPVSLRNAVHAIATDRPRFRSDEKEVVPTSMPLPPSIGIGELSKSIEAGDDWGAHTLLSNHFPYLDIDAADAIDFPALFDRALAAPGATDETRNAIHRLSHLVTALWRVRILYSRQTAVIIHELLALPYDVLGVIELYVVYHPNTPTKLTSRSDGGDTKSEARLVVALRRPVAPSYYKRLERCGEGTFGCHYKVKIIVPAQPKAEAQSTATEAGAAPPAANVRSSALSAIGCELRRRLEGTYSDAQAQTMLKAATSETPSDWTRAETYEMAAYQRFGNEHPNLIRWLMWSPPSETALATSGTHAKSFRMIYEFVEHDFKTLLRAMGYPPDFVYRSPAGPLGPSALPPFPPPFQPPVLQSLMYQIMSVYAHAESKGLLLQCVTPSRIRVAFSADAERSDPVLDLKIELPAIKIGRLYGAIASEMSTAMKEKLTRDEHGEAAPEHLCAGKAPAIATPASVIWLIGCLFIELAVGRAPYKRIIHEPRREWAPLCAAFGRPPRTLFDAWSLTAADLPAHVLMVASVMANSDGRSYPPDLNLLNYRSELIAAICESTGVLQPIVDSIVFAYLPLFDDFECPMPEGGHARRTTPLGDALNYDGRHLLASMLVWDPARRITFAAALKHPYFNAVRLPPALAQSPFYASNS